MIGILVFTSYLENHNGAQLDESKGKVSCY